MSWKTQAVSVAWSLIVFIGAPACDSAPSAAPQRDTADDGAGLDLTAPDGADSLAPDTREPEPADTTPTPLEDSEVADSAIPDTIPADTGDDTLAPECVSDSDCDAGLLCLEGACRCDPTPVSFAAEVVPLFSATCGRNCHLVASPTGGSASLNLSAAFAYDELVGADAWQCQGVGRLRVAAGDIGASYLYDKLRGRDMCSGVRMPKGRGALSAAQLAIVGRWICQGALDN